MNNISTQIIDISQVSMFKTILLNLVKCKTNDEKKKSEYDLVTTMKKISISNKQVYQPLL